MCTKQLWNLRCKLGKGELIDGKNAILYSSTITFKLVVNGDIQN